MGCDDDEGKAWSRLLARARTAASVKETPTEIRGSGQRIFVTYHLTAP